MKSFCQLAFVVILTAVLPAAADRTPGLHVIHGKDVVEIDNGLVKARFTTGPDGVKQEYLAAHGKDWVLLAEGFKPPADKPPGLAPLYNTSIDPQHRLLTTELMQTVAVE